MFGHKFDYLKVTANTAMNILHDDFYISNGIEDQSERHIYVGVEYDGYEKQLIVGLKNIIQKYKQESQADDVLLRYIYAGHFNLSNAYELFKGYMNWLTIQNPFDLTIGAKKLLEDGYIYLAGRDTFYRPTIVLNANMFNFKLFDSESFLRAVNNLLAICEDYMFYPSKIENIVVFIETSEMNVDNLPFRQLQIIILQLFQNFPQMLHRMFIFNPSRSMIAQWEKISMLIEERTLNKIKLINAEQFYPNENGFDESQIEERFGGSMPNITQFWIPINTLKIAPIPKLIVFEDNQSIQHFDDYQNFDGNQSSKDDFSQFVSKSASIQGNYANIKQQQIVVQANQESQYYQSKKSEIVVPQAKMNYQSPQKEVPQQFKSSNQQQFQNSTISPNKGFQNKEQEESQHFNEIDVKACIIM